MHHSHFVPVLRHAQVPRPHLVQRASERESALLLIRGSYGMGKTSLAVQVAEHEAARLTQVVWIAFPDLGSTRTGLWASIVGALEVAGLVPEGELPRVLPRNPASPVWQQVRRLSDAVGDLVIIIDNFDGRREPLIEPYLLAALEALPRVRLVLTGAHLGSLDQQRALRRIPVRFIDDADLLFSDAETEALLRHRVPEMERLPLADQDRLIGEVFAESEGWPVAVHAACTDLAALDLATLVLPEWARFRAEAVTALFRGLSSEEYDALLISAVGDEISPEMLARLMQIDVHRAEALLRGLTPRALMQRRDARGTRWFRHHAQLRDAMWAAPRENVSAQRARGQYRSVALALAAEQPEAAAEAALRAEDWPLLNELVGRSFTEQFLDPETAFAGGLRALPEDVRRRYPGLGVLARVVALSTPLGRTRDTYELLREAARHSLVRESEQQGVLGVAALGLRLRAAWHAGDAEQCRVLLGGLQRAFSTIAESDHHLLGWTPIAVANTAALAAVGLEDFDGAERWLEVGSAIDAPSNHAGRVHADALAAMIAAWRGDMPQASYRVDVWERRYSIDQWVSHTVAMPYLIAKAFVRYELGDDEGAYAIYRLAERHERYLDLHPYAVVIGGLVMFERYSAADALAWLHRRLAATEPTVEWMPSQRRATQDLTAALQWLSGKHQARGEALNAGFASIYAALNRGEWERAWSIAASVGNLAAEKGHVRRQLRALTLENLAREWAGEAPRQSSVHRAEMLARDFGLRGHAQLLPGMRNGRVLTASRGDAHAPEGSRVHRDRRAEVPKPAVPKTVALTRAEVRALEAVARHGNAVRAAESLNLSAHTVRDQLKACYRKLGVNAREHALREARRLGLIAA